jgi:hypothetical protein
MSHKGRAARSSTRTTRSTTAAKNMTTKKDKETTTKCMEVLKDNMYEDLSFLQDIFVANSFLHDSDCSYNSKD